MANPNPSLKTRFKSGISPNPKGRGLEDPQIRKIKKLTNDEIAIMGSMLLDCNKAQIMTIKKDKSAATIKVLIASVLLKVIDKGDASAMNAILDRIVGKVRLPVTHSGIIKNSGMTVEDVNESLKDPATRALALRLAERIADRELYEDS